MQPLKQLHPSRLRFLIVVLLVLGIVFRFVNIEERAYSGDETSTSLQIAGYTKAEFRDRVFDGRVLSVQELQKYQDVNPDKGLIDTVTAMAAENPHHPPLYYVIARFWVQLLGSSPTVTRGVAVFFSLLIFPSLYWLCLQLFESPMVGWVAIALVAVSPFHVWTAQNAREYSLWATIILLSSTALLRAMRLQTKRSWMIYAATFAVGVYSHLFFWLVAVSHGLYVVIQEGFRRTEKLKGYLLASSLGLLIFTPWILLVNVNWTRVYTTTTWAKSKLPFFFGEDTLIKRWSSNLGLTFTYVELTPNNQFLLYLLALLIGALVGYSIYFLCKTTPKRIWLFILCLMAVTGITLTLPDVLLGGQRSTSARYLTPCYLGMHLSVAYLFTTKINSVSDNIKHPKIWQVLMMLVLTSGAIACAITPANQRWSSPEEPPKEAKVMQAAHLINQTSSPLLILDLRPTEVLPFVYHLAPKVKLQLVVRPNVSKVPDGFSDVFLYRPSRELREGLEKEQNYKLEIVNDSLQLWRLQKKLLTFNPTSGTVSIEGNSNSRKFPKLAS